MTSGEGGSVPIAVGPSRRVQLLDKTTINQIAAGEVVESPAAVVKELVENAVDAGATRVDILLRDAGRTLIQISDNGCGMSPEDAVAALERHATSKIRSLRDLSAATTLGFRGEAVPSIASVSRMRISTAESDGLRTVVVIEGGAVAPLDHEAGPQGSTVSVADLFFNTPARLRFMKTDTTELRNAVEISQKLALANPHVAMTLRHQSVTLFQTPGDGVALHALAALWGNEIARALVPVDTFEAGVRVRGFVSPPEFTRATRAYQWFFVNGRVIRSRSLASSVEVAYRQLTPERRFPLVALHLDVDPLTLDVNVSPTKAEVKFQHDGTIFDAVRHGIKQTLLERGMIPSAEGIAAANEALRGAGAVREGSPHFGASGFGVSGFGAGNLDSLASTPQPGLALVHGGGGDLEGRPFGSVVEGAPNSDGFSGLAHSVFDEARGGSTAVDGEDFARDMHALLDGFRIIGQTSDCTFIIAENRSGLLIIDQHVAHERILFEMLCRERGRASLERQPLLTPETVQLEPRLAAMLSERLADVREVGFELEPFGAGAFIIRSVPAALRGRNPATFVREMAEEMMESTHRNRITPLREILWITCSCKMAIKAGDPLSRPEMEKLMLDLADTENPYLCPHGRPITIVLSWGDLLRKFKRG
ncbi:MAG: DNA mismatch repair endonuclease MutL [Chthonomonas sp.]|nr:DNA mismatch repair endonuclease MutL [Chthonomonas sp.]